MNCPGTPPGAVVSSFLPSHPHHDVRVKFKDAFPPPLLRGEGIHSVHFNLVFPPFPPTAKAPHSSSSSSSFSNKKTTPTTTHAHSAAPTLNYSFFGKPNQQRTLSKLPTELRHRNFCQQGPTEQTSRHQTGKNVHALRTYSNRATVLRTTVGGWEGVRLPSNVAREKEIRESVKCRKDLKYSLLHCAEGRKDNVKLRCICLVEGRRRILGRTAKKKKPQTRPFQVGMSNNIVLLEGL